MSMELNIFFDRSLRSIGEWQAAIDVERYPLRLAQDVDLATISGFVPADFKGKPAGFECFHDDAKDTMKSLGIGRFDRNWRFSLGLRWRGTSFDELNSAWMAATAYAAATDGVIFDYEEARIFRPVEARELVRRFEQEQPMIDALVERAIKDVLSKN